MGVYYNVSNETKKEWIDPGKIGKGGIKRFPVIYGQTANLITALMMDNWHGDLVQINADTSDHYFDVEKQYKDITLEAVKNFNSGLEPENQIQLYVEDE